MAYPEPGALWCVHTVNATRMVFLLVWDIKLVLLLRAHWPDDVSIKEIMHFRFFNYFAQ
jgi:hypothetical protein